MTKLTQRKPGWRPAGLGDSMTTFFEDAAFPVVTGSAFPLLVNFVTKKDSPELSALISAAGTVAMFAFLPNKLFGAGAASTTLIAYLVRKFNI